MARPSTTALVAARRLKVAQLHLRGLTQREIEKALDKQRIINPATGKSFSLGTINADLQALETEWDKKALEAKATKKAHVAAEIAELKRAAWADKDLKLVAELLKQEREMFKLDDPIDPIQVDVRGQINVTHRLAAEMAAIEEMDEEELDTLLENLWVAADMPANFTIIEAEYEVEQDT